MAPVQWNVERVSLRRRYTHRQQLDHGYINFTMPSLEDGAPLWLLGHANTPLVPVAFEYASLSTNDPRDAWAGAANVSDWLKAARTARSDSAGRAPEAHSGPPDPEGRASLEASKGMDAAGSSDPFFRRATFVHTYRVMPVLYRIQEGVAVVALTASGFEELRSALDAIGDDPAWCPRMPLAFDLRGEPPKVRYSDIASRLQILSEMREQFGPRWAFLIDTGPLRPGIWRMLSLFRAQEGLEVALFTEWTGVAAWLSEKPTNPGFEFRVYVGTDETGSFALLLREGDLLDPGVSWRLVGATDDEGIALGFLRIAEAETEAAKRDRHRVIRKPLQE